MNKAIFLFLIVFGSLLPGCGSDKKPNGPVVPPDGADTQPPVATVISPTNGTAVGTTAVIMANATDNTEVSHVQFMVDDSLDVSSLDNQAPYEFSIATNSFALGTAHTVRAVAVDTAGNVDTSAAVTFYARWRPVFPNLPQSATVGDTTQFTMNPSFTTGLKSIALSVNNVVEPGQIDSTLPFVLMLDATDLMWATSYEIKLTAVDSLGNIEILKQTFYYKWRSHFSDNNEAIQPNIKDVYVRSNLDRIEFRLEFNGSWSNARDLANGLFAAVYFDSDQNSATGSQVIPSTGEPIGDIGADYNAFVIPRGDSVGVWRPTMQVWQGIRKLEPVRLANNSNFVEFAVMRGDIGSPSEFDFVVSNFVFTGPTTGIRDWAPDESFPSHFTYAVDGAYVGRALE